MAAPAGTHAAVATAPAEPLFAGVAGRLMLLWGWRRALAALLAGGLGALAQAPFDFFAAAFVAFPVLVLLLDGAAGDAPRGRLRRLRPFFATGWFFGFGYFVANLFWIGNAMLVDVEKYAWAMPIAVLALPAFMALFYGVAAAIVRPLWNEGIGRIAALAAAFAVLEWARGYVLTGFPWNTVGYAAMPVPLLMQSVTVVGMMGMDALATFVFALPAMLVARRGRLPAVALIVLLAALHAGYGFLRLSMAPAGDAREIVVRLVQPAVNQAEKWDPQKRDAIYRTMLDMSAAAPGPAGLPQLIVWPETSVPFLFQQRPDALAAIDATLSDGQVLLTGAVRMEGESPSDPAVRFYNSVVSINDRGEIYGASDKQFLVPLGEFLPFADLLSRFGINKLVDLPGGFAAGARRAAVEVEPGNLAVPYICYEVIFPRVAVDARTDLIVNVTNDAWFGDSPGPYQHLRHAQLRAVEAGRPMVRAANTGISAVVDAHGRILDALALGGAGTLDLKLRLDALEPPVPVDPGLVGWGVVAAFGLAGIAGRLRRRRFN
jgi:apolipoprotein N-acyltransferase